jgi:thiocyanate desulfurase
MTEVERRTATQETPKIDLTLPLPPEDNLPARDSRAEVDAFLARREAVTKSDHEEFQQYLREKQAQARAAHAEAKPSDLKSSKITRRGMIKVAAGTAIVGESTALGYNAAVSIPPAIKSLGPGGAIVVEAQREPIARELINYKSDIGGNGLGKWAFTLRLIQKTANLISSPMGKRTSPLASTGPHRA